MMRTRMRLFTVAACLLLAAGFCLLAVAAKGKGQRGLRLEYIQQVTGTQDRGTVTETTRTRIYKDLLKRERQEDLDAEGKVTGVVLSDLTAKVAFRFDPANPEKRATRRSLHLKESATASPRHADTGWRATQPLGERTIQGLSCHGHGNADSEMWQCMEPVTGLTVVGLAVGRLPTGAEIRRSLESVEVVEVVPDMFVLPHDFTIDEDE
jgi:hypothetical protein